MNQTLTSFTEELAHSIRGRLLTGDQAAQSAHAALWSAENHARPYAVAECLGTSDVQQAVRIAAEHKIPVSVLAGGHDWAGRAVRSDALVLDIRPISRVAVSAAARSVTLGGAALTWDLLQALPADRVTPTGTVSSVGVAGLLLGGGYGRLTSQFGLTSDAMKSAEVVLADGSVAVASEAEDKDLFWALRGGGGNFGVVTSLTLETYSVPSVLSALIALPLSSARRALLRLQQVIDDKPQGLSVFSGFITFPTGDPGLFLQPLLVGDDVVALGMFDDLCALDGADVLHCNRSSYRDTFDLEAEKAWSKGKNYRLNARNLARLDDAAIDILVKSARSFPSPSCAILLHDFHGKASRIASDATAFSLRQEHFDTQIIAAWDPASDPAGRATLAWAEDVARDLSTISMPGGYINLLAPEDTDRVRQFYGPAIDRLLRTKKRVDPEDIFRSSPGRLIPY